MKNIWRNKIDFEKNGFYYIDISNPANPSLLGYFETSGCTKEVVLYKEKAYIADGVVGLRIINFSPSISSPADINHTVGTTGNSVVWIIENTTICYSSYWIYRNSTINATGSWHSGDPINISVDNLSPGLSNITILAYDGVERMDLRYSIRDRYKQHDWVFLYHRNIDINWDCLVNKKK